VRSDRKRWVSAVRDGGDAVVAAWRTGNTTSFVDQHDPISAVHGRPLDNASLRIGPVHLSSWRRRKNKTRRFIALHYTPLYNTAHCGLVYFDLVWFILLQFKLMVGCMNSINPVSARAYFPINIGINQTKGSKVKVFFRYCRWWQPSLWLLWKVKCDNTVW